MCRALDWKIKSHASLEVFTIVSQVRLTCELFAKHSVWEEIVFCFIKSLPTLYIPSWWECKMSYFLPQCLVFYIHLVLDVLIILIFWFRMQMEAFKCKTKLIGQFWTFLTSLRNLGITLSSELRLRWFKILWNAKKTLYNFHVLSFERYSLHQGWNRAWSWCTCTADVLKHSLACNSNTRIWYGLFSEVSRSNAKNFQLKTPLS